MKEQTTQWDTSEFLETEEDIAAYLAAAFEEGDPEAIKLAIGNVAKARGMKEIALQAKRSEPCANHAGIVYSEAGVMAAVSLSFQKYKEHGSRSTEKLKPLHQYIASVLAGIWGTNYRVFYLGENTKELQLEGKYYPKYVDITITDANGKPVFCLGLKFVTSNYKQNANNYFEGMMGETANIQALKNIPYVQLIIMRYKTPYYKKNETEIPSRIETFKDKDIRKYVRLALDGEQAHRPKFIGIQMVDIDEKTQNTTLTNIEDCEFSPEIKHLLVGQLSLTRFFTNIREYRDCLNALRE